MYYRTKQELAYYELREQIISGQLQPGERLNLREIATQLQCSEIPVREAIKLLEAEGLVTSIPHVGATVAILSQTDIEEINELRALLEPYAARLAASAISQSGIDELQSIVDEMAVAVANDDARRYGELNRRLHLEITAWCSNTELRKILKSLWDKDRGRIVFATVRDLERSLEEHRAIVKALRDKDPDAAEVAMIEHKRSALTDVMKLRDVQRKSIEESTS